MKAFNRRVFIVTTVLLSSAWSVVASAQGHVSLSPDEMYWTEIKCWSGWKIAILVGAPSKPGPYVIRLTAPAGAQLGPHTHPDDRTLTVLSGSWYEGFGDKLDRANAKLLPSSGFTTIPGNAVHFDIVGPEGAVLQVSGNGPSGTTWLNPADNPAAKYQ